jgi:pimeloyl-ACP methyl ester carboxylesterase
MRSGCGKWRYGFGATLLLLCILLWNPFNHALFSIRFAWSLQKLASGASEQDLRIREYKVRRQLRGQGYEALVYYSEKQTARSAVVLVAGLSELGCHHPRFIALARFLAEKGLMVITPDIKEFREFQISAKPIDQILFWYRQTSGLEGAEKIQKTGLAGISFSGTLALMAAAKPEICNEVAFVLAVGPYSSLIRCTKGWFAAAPGVSGDAGYPTRFYAKWIAMLAALDMIADSKERLFLHEVLDSLLLEKNIPPANQGLSKTGARWYALATMPETQSDPELASDIQDHLVSSLFTELDPGKTLKDVRCPLFLIHGAYDDLMPPGESLELHRSIANSFLLISPLLTHTHPNEAPLSVGQKFRTAKETLSFCYQLSRAAF